MKISYSEEMLQEIFKRLRKNEGIAVHELAKRLGAVGELSVLLNHKWKMAHCKYDRLTELENIIYNTSGVGVRTFATKYSQSDEFLGLKNIPFPQFEMSLSEVLESRVNA